jgi:hypothetical protein
MYANCTEDTQASVQFIEPQHIDSTQGHVVHEAQLTRAAGGRLPAQSCSLLLLLACAAQTSTPGTRMLHVGSRHRSH